MNEIKKLKNLRLTDPEKRELFNRISAKILKEGGKADLRYPVPSPFFKFSHLLQKKHAYITTLAVFMLVMSSGATAFASLYTLPGDFLYGVKTNVVEKIPRLVYLSPEKRAKHDFKRIEKRLEEFEKLADEGKLTEETTKEIEKNLNESFGDLDKNIKEIKEGEKKDLEDKKILEEELELKLEENTEKIKEIREDEKVEDKQVLESVLLSAESSKEELEDMAEDTEEKLEEKVLEEIEEEIEKEIDEKLEELRSEEEAKDTVTAAEPTETGTGSVVESKL